MPTYWPSPPAVRVIETPLMWLRESATLSSGKRPSSVAEIESTTTAALRLMSSDLARLARAPVTRSEERRVGKECRSLCDWSSDVCSSDLVGEAAELGGGNRIDHHGGVAFDVQRLGQAGARARHEIGRASCRERV